MHKVESDTTIIQPSIGWFDLNLAEIWRYRDLIYLFVRRDFVALYKQTILGPLWYLISPLTSTLVFTIVFGKIAQLSTDGTPPFLFYLSGLVCWSYFATCLTQTSQTFVSNAAIFSKVYFPRLVFPISIVISNLFSFAIQLSLFLGFLIFYKLKGAPIQLGTTLFVFPLLVLQMAILGLSIGILISALTTKYRDLNHLIGFGLQLWMYATPIVYPMSQIPQKYHLWFTINPMVSVVETFRYSFLGVGGVSSSQWLLSWATTLALLVLGTLLFSRTEKVFMDTI